MHAGEGSRAVTLWQCIVRHLCRHLVSNMMRLKVARMVLFRSRSSCIVLYSPVMVALNGLLMMQSNGLVTRSDACVSISVSRPEERSRDPESYSLLVSTSLIPFLNVSLEDKLQRMFFVERLYKQWKLHKRCAPYCNMLLLQLSP